MSVVQRVSLDEFWNMLRAQEVPMEDWAFTCPMCGTLQSAQDLIDAGAGTNFDEVEKYLAFSCVGRFTGAAAPRREHDGKPCNWTLGGLFQCHELEVEMPDGKLRPRFMPASPAEAQVHMVKRRKSDAKQ